MADFFAHEAPDDENRACVHPGPLSQTWCAALMVYGTETGLERLIQKFEFDKEILADQDDEEQDKTSRNERPPTDVALARSAVPSLLPQEAAGSFRPRRRPRRSTSLLAIPTPFTHYPSNDGLGGTHGNRGFKEFSIRAGGGGRGSRTAPDREQRLHRRSAAGLYTRCVPALQLRDP